MSDLISIDYQLTGRLGHNSFHLEFQKNSFTFQHTNYSNPAIYQWHEGNEPSWIWDDFQNWRGNSLDPILATLEYQGIYPPSNFTNALISAWKDWRTSSIKDEDFEKAILELLEWVENCRKIRPLSLYWKGKF